MNFSSAENQGAALLNVGQQSAGTVVKLCDASGKELLTWTADKEFSSLAITCPEMQQGESYTLYCGDSDVDILFAHNAGAKGLGCLWGFRGEAELKAAGADLLAAQPKDILTLI